MLPSSCLVNRRLLTFVAAFRLYSFRRLTKSQQQMIAPQGNFAIAQFRRLFDSPDINLLLADCWGDTYDQVDLTPGAKSANAYSWDMLLAKMEDYLIKAYAIAYSQPFHFDHVYPTRSLPTDSDLFQTRETLLKQQLAPLKYKKLITQQKKPAAAQADKENTLPPDEYKPFNIAEMEICVSGLNANAEAKTDELTKMYQQMGLLLY